MPIPRSLCRWPCAISPALGDEISEEKPLLDRDAGRITRCGSVPALLAPGDDPHHPEISLERFTPDELVRIGTLTLGLMKDIRDAVENRQNILISGGTGTGKTTLLNALASFMIQESGSW